MRAFPVIPDATAHLLASSVDPQPLCHHARTSPQPDTTEAPQCVSRKKRPSRSWPITTDPLQALLRSEDAALSAGAP